MRLKRSRDLDEDLTVSLPLPTEETPSFSLYSLNSITYISYSILLLGLSLLWSGKIEAQNHPELDWRVFETAHFRVLYHQGLEHAASRAAQIAEEAYGPITQLYGYEPSERVRR